MPYACHAHDIAAAMLLRCCRFRYHAFVDDAAAVTLCYALPLRYADLRHALLLRCCA